MAQNSLTTTDKEIVIDLKIEGAKEALAAVANATKEIDQLKDAQKALKQEYKDGIITEKEYYSGLVKIKTQMQDQKNTLKANQRILDEQVKAYKKNEDSINSMRAKLKLLRAQYEDLSKAERDSAKGTELLNKIKSLNDEIKELEKAQGDYTRNVGNYQDIWNASADQIKSFGETFNSVWGGNSIFVLAMKKVQGLGQEIVNLSKQWDEDAKKTKAQAESNASATTKAYTDVGKSIQNVGETAKDETVVVQGFGKALYNTSEPAKDAATSMNETAKAAENLNDATKGVAESADNTTSFGEKMHGAAMKLKDGFIMGAKAVGQLGKQLLQLMSNPWVALFTAITAVVMKLVKAFKQNDTAMTELKKAMSAFQPVLDAINWLFEKLVGTVTKVISVLGAAAKAIGGFFGGDAYKQSQQRAEQLVTAMDALEDKEREYTLAHADNEAKIAELREKASDAENYTIEERKKFLQESIDIERVDLAEKRAIAEEKVRIAEQEALQQRGYLEMTAEAWANLTDEEKDNITQLRAALRETDREMSDFERKMNKQLNSLSKSATNAGNTAANARKERLKNEQEAFKALEELEIKLIKDLAVKEREQLKLNYKNQIEQIQLKLKTEKNLTVAARKALNDQIVLLEADLQVQLGELSLKYTRDRLTKELQERVNYYTELLGSLSEDEAKVQVQLELNKAQTDLALAQLKANYETAVKSIEDVITELNNDVNKLTPENILSKYADEFKQYGIPEMDDAYNMLRALIKKKEDELLNLQSEYVNNESTITRNLALQKTKIEAEQYLKSEDLARQHEEVMAQIIGNNELLSTYYNNELQKTKIAEEQAKLRVSHAKSEYNDIVNLTEQEQLALYGSFDAYEVALAQSYQKVQEAELNLKDATQQVIIAQNNQKQTMVDNANTIANAFNSISASMQGLFEQMAESDEKYSKYATAMAMMQILVSTAISIANAIQGATSAGAATGVAAPLTTPVFIAEMVAIVASALVSATSLLMKAKQAKPNAPQFATGGPVDKSHTGGMVGRHTTTRTDDTIDAKLSLGEYVIQSKIVKKYGVEFFDNINENKTRKRLDLPLRFATGGAVPSVHTIKETQTQVDYSQMKEIFTEAVSEIQPIVSVKEITNVQNRVQTKENIASYK